MSLNICVPYQTTIQSVILRNLLKTDQVVILAWLQCAQGDAAMSIPKDYRKKVDYFFLLHSQTCYTSINVIPKSN